MERVDPSKIVDPNIRAAYEGGVVFNPHDPIPAPPRTDFRNEAFFLNRRERVTVYSDGKVVRGRQL